jgi:hypothetical protein
MLTAPAVIPRALAARVNESCSATATNTRRLESGRRLKAVLLFGFEFLEGRLGAGIATSGRRDMLSRPPDDDNVLGPLEKSRLRRFFQTPASFSAAKSAVFARGA